MKAAWPKAQDAHEVSAAPVQKQQPALVRSANGVRNAYRGAGTLAGRAHASVHAWLRAKPAPRRGAGALAEDHAEAAGSYDEFVQRIKRGRATSAAERAERVVALNRIVLVLDESDALTPRGVAHWFNAPNPLLDGATPLELVASGCAEAAVHAAIAFAQHPEVDDPGTLRAAS